MIGTTFRVMLDANVLFPFTLRDTLLRAAHAGYFQVYWSEEILEETTRNLKKQGRMSDDQAEHLVREMAKAFPEASIHGYELLIPAMQNDEKDRHVAAAAVKAGAEVIVTSNLKDFKHLPDGIEAQGPDEFLVDLLDLYGEAIVQMLHMQAAALKNPEKTLVQLLEGLAKTAPQFVKRVRNEMKD